MPVAFPGPPPRVTTPLVQTVVQPAPPSTSPAPSAQVQVVVPSVTVNVPGYTEPQLSASADGNIRTDDRRFGDVIPWPRGTPLAVRVQNTHDQIFDVELHVQSDPNTLKVMKEPAARIEVGVNDEVRLTLDPAAGDQWARWIFATYKARGVPLTGKIEIEFQTFDRVGGAQRVSSG